MSMEDGGWDQVRVGRRCTVILDGNFGMERGGKRLGLGRSYIRLYSPNAEGVSLRSD